MSEQGIELQRSFNRYLKRNQAWVFIILTGIILFVSVFVYRSHAKSTNPPIQNYNEHTPQIQRQIHAKEKRLQQLQEQNKQLQEKSN